MHNNIVRLINRYTLWICLLLSLVLLMACNQEKKEANGLKEYDVFRKDLMNANEKKAFDYSIILSREEKLLNKKIKSLREETIHHFSKHPKFYELSKQIDTTKLFAILKTMPKGGLLHSHSGGLTDIHWLINRAKEFDECYVYTRFSNDQYLFGQLNIYSEAKVPSGFVRLKDILDENTSFENQLYDLLVLNKAQSANSLGIWPSFENRFKRIAQLISYRPFFLEYYQKAFEDLIEDGISHVEIRYVFDEIYDLQGRLYGSETIINDLNNIVEGLNESGKVLTLGLIYSSFKFFDVPVIENKITEAIRLKKKYPRTIVGFDLVAEEDAWNSLVYYKKCWDSLTILENQYKIDLPLILHAGESLSLSNSNLFDAILLNTKRIGHGLNLAYFPELVEQVIEKDILVELNPLSNTLLGYVKDPRNHPARTLMKYGVQCSISSDDPGVFGYEGLSYDFWYAFVHWELDLKSLKKLVFNSIEYSSLEMERKKRAITKLNQDWDIFVESTNRILK
ncbi:adenosine kinase [Maribacter sp. 2304DJ31-5]|uniref:adenosine kinase n=1 Tax=Maribacter sp. 2304DJ31-5 TaxID=3386273 RepID=UPI0039BC64FC